jgi:polysaccharide transporter, PST family
MNIAWVRIMPAFIREHIESRLYLQNVLGNMGWLFADRIVRMGVGLLVGVWVARYLGPEKFGILNFSYAFVLLFSAVSSMGLESVAVRDLASDPSRKNEILGTVFTLKIAGGALAFLLTVAAILLVRKEDPLARWLVGIIALGGIFQAFDAIDFWFQSQILSKYTVVAKCTAFLSVSLVKVGLILAKAPVIAFAMAGTLEIGLGSAFLVIAYRKNGFRVNEWRILAKTAFAMLKDSSPLLFSGIFVMLYIRIDQVMIGEMLGSSAVGVYSAAVSLTEVWYFIPMIITASVLPAIVDAKKKDEILYYDRLKKLFLVMFWISLVGPLLITLFSRGIVHLVFGTPYTGAASPLSIQCWAGLFIFSGLVSNQWYLVENLNRYTLYRHITGATVNVLGNLVLIPMYGIDGAAIATLLTQFFASYLFDYFIPPARVLFRIKTRTYFLFLPITYKYIRAALARGRV